MRYAACAVLLAACAEPVAQMTLELPTTTASVDLTCVSAVDLMPISSHSTAPLDISDVEYLDQQAPVSCVDLSSQPKSLEDVATQIRGKFDFEIPSGGLEGFELRGRGGNCTVVPAYFDAMFYGGGTYAKGQESVPIKVAHNLSCDQSASFTVHAIDLVQLLTAKTCVSVDGSIYDGNIRPTLLDSISPIVWETGTTYAATTAGVATVQSFKSSFAGTCPAVGWADATDSNETASCINSAAATACSTPGQIELPTISGNIWSEAQGNGGPYAGAVIAGAWSASAKAPIQGATVTLDANSDAKIVYGALSPTGFAPNSGATSTDLSGAFIVYTNQVVGITVANGSSSTHLYVGGDAVEPTAALAVL